MALFFHQMNRWLNFLVFCGWPTAWCSTISKLERGVTHGYLLSLERNFNAVVMTQQRRRRKKKETCMPNNVICQQQSKELTSLLLQLPWWGGGMRAEIFFVVSNQSSTTTYTYVHTYQFLQTLTNVQSKTHLLLWIDLNTYVDMTWPSFTDGNETILAFLLLLFQIETLSPELVEIVIHCRFYSS